MVHRTSPELEADLRLYAEKISIGSTRYHRKHPEVSYTIRDLVIDEATDLVAVVYENPQGIRFVRLAEIFLEQVTYPDGVIGPRFIQKT